MSQKPLSMRIMWIVAATAALMAGCTSPEPPPTEPTARPTTTAPPTTAATTIAKCVPLEEQQANAVTLTRTDGKPVKAMAYGSGETAIVFANEVNGDLCQWRDTAKALALKGYLTVVFNYSTITGHVEDDVLAGAATARQRGAKRVFLVGASMGGTAVLAAAAAAKPAVAGVISLSGPEMFSATSAASVMSTFVTPVIFIAADGDTRFSRDARKLYSACAAKDKKLVVRDGSRHGVALVDAETLDLMEKFFANHS